MQHLIFSWVFTRFFSKMNILFNVRVVFYVIHFAARNTLRYSQTTGSYYTLQAAQQVADIGGMGGRPARVPGKNALTFDHILNRLPERAPEEP